MTNTFFLVDEETCKSTVVWTIYNIDEMSAWLAREYGNDTDLYVTSDEESIRFDSNDNNVITVVTNNHEVTLSYGECAIWDTENKNIRAYTVGEAIRAGWKPNTRYGTYLRLGTENPHALYVHGPTYDPNGTPVGMALDPETGQALCDSYNM